MKYIILTLLVFSVNTYSQNNKTLSDTILNKKCSINHEYDKFNKTNIYKTNFSLYGSPGMTIVLTRYNNGDNDELDSYYIKASSTPSGCVTRDSYIQFLLENGEVVHFNHIDDINCGVSSGTFKATKEGLTKLLKNKITDIRIYFDSKRDVKVGKNHDLKLKSYFYCILNCK